MIDEKELNRRTETLQALLRDKLGVRGKTLSKQLRRAGRLLPARLQREARLIVSAHQRIVHPRLAATIDEAQLKAAYSGLMEHLSAVDPKDRRKGKLLSWLGGQVFNFLLIGGAVIAVLIWRGLIG